MQPTFRTDLQCSREEQQGVVFYRIDDPDTKASFRLYEIEYLIAQKLDGQRTPQEVIEAVKAEYSFDISDADLAKFIQQLESMGFVRPGDAPRLAVAPAPRQSTNAEIITQEMTSPPVDHGVPFDGIEMDLSLDAQPPSDAPAPLPLAATDTEVEVEAEASAPQPTGVDRAELTRLLKSAFLHVKQGYVVHARDYFLAAKELNPEDPKLMRLASSVEVLEDKPASQELEALWKQCRESFPDIAADIVPMLESRDGQVDSLVAHAAKRSNEAWHKDERTRVRLMLFLLLLVIGAGSAGWYAVTQLKVFQGAAKIRAQSIASVRAPVFFPAPAIGVRPVREVWLTFGSAGNVGDMPKVGARVEAGELVAELDLPPKFAAQAKTTHALIAKADADYEKVAKNLEKVMGDRQAVEAERDGAEEHIKVLRPQSVLKQDANARKELDLWKKALAKANKKLSIMSKRERGPRALEAKAKKRVELAHKRLALLEEKIGDKLLKAPFAGQIIEVKAAAGQGVEPTTQIVLLRDPIWARLTFVVKNKVALQPGAEVFISVKGGSTLTAKLASIGEVTSGIELQVDIADPAGTLLTMPPDSFRMVSEYAEHAFRVRTAALVAVTGNVGQVLIVQGGRVNRSGVMILDQSGGDSLLKAQRDLHDGSQIAIARDDGQSLETLHDGDSVDSEVVTTVAPQGQKP